MFRVGENFHSRFIAWAKIILPLVALAILSSLFLFSKSYDPTETMRNLGSKLGELTRKQKIVAPKFAGMTPEGVSIQISAREGSPREGDVPAFDAVDLKALVETPDGKTIHVVAAKGSVNSLKQMARLTGGITLKTSFGVTAKTRGLVFALDRLDIRSQGKITATAPRSKIEAGQMYLHLDKGGKDETPPGYVLVFNNGVRMIYTP